MKKGATWRTERHEAAILCSLSFLVPTRLSPSSMVQSLNTNQPVPFTLPEAPKEKKYAPRRTTTPFETLRIAGTRTAWSSQQSLKRLVNSSYCDP